MQYYPPVDFSEIGKFPLPPDISFDDIFDDIETAADGFERRVNAIASEWKAKRKIFPAALPLMHG